MTINFFLLTFTSKPFNAKNHISLLFATKLNLQNWPKDQYVNSTWVNDGIELDPVHFELMNKLIDSEVLSLFFTCKGNEFNATMSIIDNNKK